MKFTRRNQYIGFGRIKEIKNPMVEEEREADEGLAGE